MERLLFLITGCSSGTGRSLAMRQAVIPLMAAAGSGCIVNVVGVLRTLSILPSVVRETLFSRYSGLDKLKAGQGS